MQNMPCSQWSSAPSGWPHSWSDSSGWDFTRLMKVWTHSIASAFRVTLWCVFRLFLFETSDDLSHGKGLGSFGFTADEASHGQTAKLRNECLRDTIGRRCSANISPILTSCVGVGHRQWTPSDNWTNWTNLFTNWMVNLSVRPIVEFDYYILLLVMTSSVASWRPSELSKVIQANPLSKERNRWCQRRLPGVRSQSSPDWVENPLALVDWDWQFMHRCFF